MRYTNDGTLDGFPLINGTFHAVTYFDSHNQTSLTIFYIMHNNFMLYMRFVVVTWNFSISLHFTARSCSFTKCFSYRGWSHSHFSLISKLLAFYLWKLFGVLFVKMFDDKKNGVSSVYVFYFFKLMQGKRACIESFNFHSTINQFSSGVVFFLFISFAN